MVMNRIQVVSIRTVVGAEPIKLLIPVPRHREIQIRDSVICPEIYGSSLKIVITTIEKVVQVKFTEAEDFGAILHSLEVHDEVFQRGKRKWMSGFAV